MSWGTAIGRENLAAVEFLESERVKKGRRTVNLLTGFAKPGGADLENVLFLCAEFDLKSELLGGRAKTLTETDFLVWRDSRTTKNTPCFYNNPPPNQYVGNYKNWAYAQPAKDWSMGLINRLLAILKVLRKWVWWRMSMKDSPNLGDRSISGTS